METLVKILPEDLTGKLHVGQPDSPELSPLAMQELMDAHPKLIDAKFNALVDAQNANNALILPKGGTTPFTPIGDYDPATKKYVQDTLNASGSITPEQIELINEIPNKANISDVATAAQGALADNAMPISGGTFTGVAVAQSNTSYTTRQVRNIIISTSEPTSEDGQNGDLFFQYTEE